MTAVLRWGLMAGLVVGLVGLAAGGVLAHKGKLPEDALTLVQQASALLAQNPNMSGEVKERLQMALQSKKPAGVRLDQVREALRALDRRDVATARLLLMEAIQPTGMPKPPEGPERAAPPSGAPPSPRAAAAPAAPPSLPSVEVAMKMAEPLRVEFAGSTTEAILLAVALALIGLGLTSLWRSREEARP